ncbi:MAG: hypothetical protein NTZ19_14435, partial [Bacteroidetes bacterium]|nr:hypothetical protein [Bacteroidota bacterium]
IDLLMQFKSIEKDEIKRNPLPPNDDERKIFISSEHVSFPFLLAIYLFVNSPLKYFDILEYHRKKFEYNNLIKKAPFLKLLSLINAIFAIYFSNCATKKLHKKSYPNFWYAD